jgi:hypothetical protein
MLQYDEKNRRAVVWVRAREACSSDWVPYLLLVDAAGGAVLASLLDVGLPLVNG